MVTLGNTYTDNVTGIEGVATARSTHLHGCVRVCLEFLKDGKPEEWWFDEQRLVDTSPAPTGGPRSTPPPRSTP